MDDKLQKIQKLLDVSEGNLQTARNLLREYLNQSPKDTLDVSTKLRELGLSNSDAVPSDNTEDGGTIIEGVFNGTEMIGPDGKAYTVPANYASKSKLIEGDGLKLTISEDGSYIFKQISPVERRNIIGTLSYNNGQYTVDAEGKTYRVLTASVTFYKAEPGDQVSIIIPREHDSVWATLENVIKKQDTPSATPATSEPQIVMPENSVKITAVDYDNEEVEPANIPATEVSAAPVANKLFVNDLDNPVTEEAPTTPTFEPTPEMPTTDQPEMVLPEQFATPPQNVTPEVVTEPSITLPETTSAQAAPQPAPNQDLGPEIEFPAGPSLSDDEILAKLKANIASNQQVVANVQPAAPVTPTSTNEVAADLDKIMGQQAPAPQSGDVPISELDI